MSNKSILSQKELKKFAEEFGVTENNIKSFLKIIEQKNIPAEDIHNRTSGSI